MFTKLQLKCALPLVQACHFPGVDVIIYIKCTYWLGRLQKHLNQPCPQGVKLYVHLFCYSEIKHYLFSNKFSSHWTDYGTDHGSPQVQPLANPFRSLFFCLFFILLMNVLQL